ncbi:7-cyano-7-deazaguanine synthase QueC [Candidatus Omnitrophota bacterium]
MNKLVDRKNRNISNGAKAVVLLSGGIDSATTLYYAKSKGFKAYCLSFDYGQRHKKELLLARRLASKSESSWKLLNIKLPWKGSALLDKRAKLPKAKLHRRDIPATYVPARNIIFLSFAASYAETLGADRIFIGANQIDYSGYPDCRDNFLQAFNHALDKGTKRGAEGKRIKIEAPLIRKNKRDIIRSAIKLGVPLKYTWSCYKGEERPCLRCDSCVIRANGFKDAGIDDPLLK